MMKIALSFEEIVNTVNCCLFIITNLYFQYMNCLLEILNSELKNIFKAKFYK